MSNSKKEIYEHWDHRRWKHRKHTGQAFYCCSNGQCRETSVGISIFVIDMQTPVTNVEDSLQWVPVPPILRRRLWYGIIGAGLFAITAGIEGASRADYDAWQQSVSALSLSPRGWIQTLSFFVFGIFIISTVTPWRKILFGSRATKSFPILTLLTGSSLILCGVFPQDPAPGYDPQQLALTSPTLIGLLHLLFAGVGAICSIAGLLVMARHFAKIPLWHGWKLYSGLMALTMTASVITYAIWSTKSTGYAGTFERIGLLVVPVWGITFLIRLESGVPFMKVATLSNPGNLPGKFF